MPQSSTTKLWWSIASRFLLVLAVAAAAAVTIGHFVGLRLEVDGSGFWPLLSQFDEDTHSEVLEIDRSRQPGAPLVSTSQTELPDSFWPAYRGLSRDGHYMGKIQTEWPTSGLPVVWKQPIGGGYASFIHADGRLFTIEQRRDREVVTAYDPNTGTELWAHGWEERFEEMMGGNGPRATPTWDNGRLFALGAAGELRSLDAKTGSLRWRRNILTDAEADNLYWAMSAAPLVVDNLVIVLPGGTSGQSVTAYHADTGAIMWHSLDDIQSYTAPMLTELDGELQVVVVTASRIAGLRVDTGALLWDYPWVVSTVPNISQPITIDSNRLFISAGYGQGSALIEVTRSSDGWSVTELWRTNRMKNKFSSSVLYDGHIYGLDESILACLDVETGELVWKAGRYGYGQLLLADKHLVVLTERGEVALVAATPSGHTELARFSAITGKTWNVPTLAAGMLFVRNTTEMAAFDIVPR